jgi:hypothetical protein
MPAEQLPLLGLDAEVPARRPTRPRARREFVSRPSAPIPPPALAPGEVVVEHRHPEALDFLREHGPDAVAVLTVLVVDAEVVDGRLVVRASTRGVAERLGFLSKDSAHRRLRQLRRAGVLEALPSTGPMDPPSYVLHLDGTGISVTHANPSR